ncbi:hypothetical protein [Actinomadura nitritigenes]|uniref:hypothetical protein n=1 Tax=Actinomadura nitritigenes TaxID=134602 RepID=UPI003D9281B7
MTIDHITPATPTTSSSTGASTTASPADLDLRRQLARARRELAEARGELDARREQETALREHLEQLGQALTVSEHLRAEQHVCYVELLTHARATAAAAARGELAPATYIAGHLEEIGLQPPCGAVPEQVVAEGLIVAIGLQAGEAVS